MVGKRINNLPSVSDYTDEDYLIVEQESGTRKGTFKQVTDTIVRKLAEDDTLSSNLITSSGAISALGNANGKPMSGSFYVDNGYKLIAPSYDNDNNRVENTESAYVPTLIDVHYNYNSNYTASRYPNFWTIGNTDLDLNIYAKDNTYISSNVKCDGNLDVSGGTLKLNCKANGSNNITGVDFFANQFNFLSNVKNGRMNEIHLGDANAKLNVYSMEEPTFFDSSKMQTYKFLTEGNIANTRINGIWLNELGGAIYGGTAVGSDGSIAPLYKILEVVNNGTITLGNSQYNTLNINCKAARVNGETILTEDNCDSYINSDVTYFAGTYIPGSSGLPSDSYNVNDCLTKSNDFSGDIFTFKPPVAGIYEISMSISTASGDTPEVIDYGVGHNLYSSSKIITATIANTSTTTNTTYHQLSGKAIFKCTSTSDTTHIVGGSASNGGGVTIVIKLIKRL